MTSFTVRIVLHDADSVDYDCLHEEMQNEGFTNEIISTKGTLYRMPDAEYDISGPLTCKDVLIIAKKAASNTGKKFAVLVTESSVRKWHGLEKV